MDLASTTLLIFGAVVVLVGLGIIFRNSKR